MTGKQLTSSHIDDIIGLIDKVLGPDDGGPVPTGLSVYHPPVVPHVRRIGHGPVPYPIVRPRPRSRGSRSGFGVHELKHLTFDDLLDYLGPRSLRQLANNTTIARLRFDTSGAGVNVYTVTLYETNILTFAQLDGEDTWTVTLNTGGYTTTTTKQRLNALLFKTSYSIYAKNRVWFLSTPDGDVEFEDGMSFEV